MHLYNLQPEIQDDPTRAMAIKWRKGNAEEKEVWIKREKVRTWETKTQRGKEKKKKKQIMAVTIGRVIKDIWLQEGEGVTDAGCGSIVRR